MHFDSAPDVVGDTGDQGCNRQGRQEDVLIDHHPVGDAFHLAKVLRQRGFVLSAGYLVVSCADIKCQDNQQRTDPEGDGKAR